MNPLVSIIMGVYNEEKNLQTCIDSIINQTYDNWEFIICDDCSTDGSVRVLEEYRNKDSRITVLKNENNSRLAQTLNNCLKVAKGEFIARMDADDISLPDRIQKQVVFLIENPGIDCVGTGRIMFDESGDRGVRFEIERPTKNTLLLSQWLSSA